MRLILCRALRVYFIHDLFHRSSLEEEVGLFGGSLPAKSQIRLFNYMYSSESIFPRAESTSVFPEIVSAFLLTVAVLALSRTGFLSC